jgi:hypothetical protein
LGIIVAPLALLIAIAWFGAILLPVFAIDRLTRGLIGGRWLAFVLYPTFLYLGWWIPNIPGHQKQQRMDAIAKQCGWTQTKRIDNVPGVYIDGKNSQAFAPELLEIYGAVEYESEGRIVHTELTNVPGSRYSHQYLDNRTFRFGVRRDEHKLVADGIWRGELVVLDFESQEILGRRVEYGFSEPLSKPSLVGYAIDFLLYRPRACGHTNPGQTDIRTELPKTIAPKYRGAR